MLKMMVGIEKVLIESEKMDYLFESGGFIIYDKEVLLSANEIKNIKMVL